MVRKDEWKNREKYDKKIKNRELWGVGMGGGGGAKYKGENYPNLDPHNKIMIQNKIMSIDWLK